MARDGGSCFRVAWERMEGIVGHSIEFVRYYPRARNEVGA